MAAGAITVDVRGFKSQVDKIARQWGVNSSDVMRDQMALWAEDLVRNTPHKNAKRKAINDAIRRNVEGVFEATETAAHLRWFQKKLAEGSWGPDVDIFDQVPMDQHYARYRNPRTGKVRRVKGGVKVGGFDMSRKLHVTKRDRNAFVRKKQKSTGKARARWLPAIRRWGGRSPASWIARHSNAGMGRATDAMNKDGDGYLEAAGFFKFNERKISGVVQFTGRKRETDVTKHLQKRMEKVVKRENARR